MPRNRDNPGDNIKHLHSVHGTIPGEATRAGHRKDFEAMAKRRFQSPKPERVGKWWYLRVWEDVFSDGVCTRTRNRKRLAPASMPEREVRKLAAEKLRPVNQGLISAGSAITFEEYVNQHFTPMMQPTFAKTTWGRYEGIIRNYLIPAFGGLCLRDLTRLS